MSEKRIQLTKIDSDTYEVRSYGQLFGNVFSVERHGRTMWDFESNPFPGAVFHRPYLAAKKMVERRGRQSSIEQLNGRPLATVKH